MPKKKRKKEDTLTTWCEAPTYQKRPWFWERLRAGEGMTDDEMVGWHHQLNGYEFDQNQGDTEGQGCMVCCSLWGLKESDPTEQMNNNGE